MVPMSIDERDRSNRTLY